MWQVDGFAPPSWGYNVPRAPVTLRLRLSCCRGAQKARHYSRLAGEINSINRHLLPKVFVGSRYLHVIITLPTFNTMFRQQKNATDGTDSSILQCRAIRLEIHYIDDVSLYKYRYLFPLIVRLTIQNKNI